MKGLWGGGVPRVNWSNSRRPARWSKINIMHPSRLELLATLSWLVDAGADEALNEQPTDRFAAVNPVHTPAAAELHTQPPSFTSESASEGPGGDALASAIDAAARCRTLSELQAALEAFDGCALKAYATHTVFADGTPESGIMFIGEAPGHDEDRVGRPFVGRAGKLLDKMLAAIGLERDRVYIINVLPWRPPDNRSPEPTEVAKCIPFLRRHIELAQPRIMILLGAVAVRHVLGHTEGIMRLRGRWLQYHVGGRMIPVMPTLHPAYLLRRPVDKRLAWRDLQAIASRIQTLRQQDAG